MPHRLHIQDHPRVCGEKHMIENSSEIPLGSPPRVRGKAFAADALDAAAGITPACAGKRSLPSEKRNPVGDHPRVCGEKDTAGSLDAVRVGSPPRVRGKDSESGSQSGTNGITPACAGKRLKRSHSIGHFSCILCLFHSVLHRASVSGGSRAGPCAPPCLPAQNAVPV